MSCRKRVAAAAAAAVEEEEEAEKKGLTIDPSRTLAPPGRAGSRLVEARRTRLAAGSPRRTEERAGRRSPAAAEGNHRSLAVARHTADRPAGRSPARSCHSRTWFPRMLMNAGNAWRGC